MPWVIVRLGGGSFLHYQNMCLLNGDCMEASVGISIAGKHECIVTSQRPVQPQTCMAQGNSAHARP